MRHTLKNIIVGQKQKRWPTGYHYVCKTKHEHPKLKGEEYEFFLDEEEYEAIKAVESLNLSEEKAIKVMKIIEKYGSFKYDEGYMSASEDEGI